MSEHSERMPSGRERKMQMARLSEANVLVAREIMSRFPRPKSALIPLLHLAQEQDGHVTTDAMAHVAELIGVTPAEVYGTATFYEMFKFEPVGRYCVTSAPTSPASSSEPGSCSSTPRSTSASRPVAPPRTACSPWRTWSASRPAPRRPRIQVNYRYRHNVTAPEFDRLVEDLRAGRLTDEIPPHGTLARIRQKVAADRWAGTGAEAAGQGRSAR